MESRAGEPPSLKPQDDAVVPSGPGATVSFADLVRAHGDLVWSQKDPDSLPNATQNFRSVSAAFEDTYGRIDNAYWANDLASAAALTAGRRRGALGGVLGKETEPRLHVLLSWQAFDASRAVELLHRCEVLAIRASVSLVGSQRRLALNWVFAVVTRGFTLLQLGSAEPARMDAELRQMDEELRNVGEFVDKASAQDTRVRYVWGMLLGLLIVAIGTVVAEVTAGSTATVDRVSAAAAAGALGAVMSVLLRMRAGRLGLPNELDRTTIVYAGTLRAFVGAAFGLVVYCLFASRLVVVMPTGPTNSTSVYTYAVIAFFAGYAERWVRVVVEPDTSLSTEQVADRIPAAVEESVRATLLGPVLARWHGFVSVSITGHETTEGESRLPPLEQTELTITFGQKETRSVFERPINIREGEEAPEVSFMLRLDSDTVSLTDSRATVAVKAEGTASTRMSFTTPRATGSHRVWLRVSQRNRVVQIVPIEFEVMD